MNKSVLILGRGDTNYNDRNARRLFSFAKQAGMNVQRAEYGEQLPDFKHDTIVVMLFFPYAFWNEHCEVPEDTELYGTSRSVYERFRQFFLDIKQALEARYSIQQLDFIIHPEHAALDRDKVATLDLLRQNRLPVSEIVPYTCLQDVLDCITHQRGVFIKCRYGAEGKGITVLHHGQWKTNYDIQDNRLGNHGVYGTWPFVDMTGETDLLEQLLQHEVIVEREILSPPLFEGKKFDVRAYVVDGAVPYFFLRINDNEGITTNFSQGAEALHNPCSVIPAEYSKAIQSTAAGAAQAFGSRFIGIDMMFDSNADGIKIVEAQTFTDFPDIDNFNLARYMVQESCLFK